jgi:hypothetical protein
VNQVKNLIKFVVVVFVAEAILAHYAITRHWTGHNDRLSAAAVFGGVLVAQIVWRAASRDRSGKRKPGRQRPSYAIVPVKRGRQ